MGATEFDDIPWAELKEIGEKGLFEQVFKKIPKARFRFTVEEKNREALIASALKSLKKTNPDASYEQAAALADSMRHFAREVLEG